MQAIPVGITPSTPAPAGNVVQLGLTRAAPLSTVLKEQQDAERRAAEARQAQPFIGNLAGHIRKCWVEAREAKRPVERRMLASLRARRGEYDPDKHAAICEMGGSDVYPMLTSVKCRGAASWIRDVIMGQGVERPWGIQPSTVPDIDPEVNEQIVRAAAVPIVQATAAGMPPDDELVQELMRRMRDQVRDMLKKEAVAACDRMADKMADQQDEGGFLEAIDQVIDDVTTFPAAILKGPVIRRKPRLKWAPAEGGKFTPVVDMKLVMEWERVDPLKAFPSPSATDFENGYFIEQHQMYRQDLHDLIGVEGYDEASIRAVLDTYAGGLRNWLVDDVEQAQAEGKPTLSYINNTDGTIDALQFWGCVPGKMLREWGMSDADVPDPVKEYHVEAWLIGSYVIKAVLNYDPLNRKPYFKASYEDIPGSFWGNSVADLVRDTQSIVGAAARALVNNMAMASGPQVAVSVDRLAPGENLTQLTPWRVWQMVADPVIGGAQGQPPITFFQPDSNVDQLLKVFEFGSALADEYSGVPKYMTGEAAPGGAGRTASGLSMMISNASKGMKQVISNIDMNMLRPAIERQYYHNMQFSEDPELKGDVVVVAKGAAALIAKETAQVRRNEFLVATANPIDMQIVGIEGRAAVLREVVRELDMDVDKIVPDLEAIRARQMAMQAMAPPPGPETNGQQLQNGAPVTDNFSPPSTS